MAEDFTFPAVHPGDVGVVVAHLLVSEGHAVYNRGQYTLNGPEGTTGRDVVKLVEQTVGMKVEDVPFKDNSYLFDFTIEAAIAHGYSRKLMSTVYASFDGLWHGEWEDCPTNEPLLKLDIPQRKIADVFNELIST